VEMLLLFKLITKQRHDA